MTSPASRLTLVFREIADGALLIRFPGASDAEANRAAVALDGALTSEPGLLESIPGARSLLLLFEPRETSGARLASAARACAERSRDAAERVEGRLHRVSVLYGGEAGPDLSELASSAGMTSDRFVELHSAGEYRVAFLGFAPGFAYMTGLPPELAAARLSTPRTRVPGGSVAIGGEYTGIYPGGTPGGWRLVGRAPIRLFDATRRPPALLAPGDRVRFEPRDPNSGETARMPPDGDASAGPTSFRGRPIFRVAAAGVWTTIVGAPRFGWARAGVAPGGAMDLPSLVEGNSRLGNPASAPAVEMSFVGPELDVLSDAVIAFSGASVDAESNGRRLPPDSVSELRRGDRVRVGPLRGGARAYLCVRGGLELPPGPWPVRRLNRADVLTAMASPAPSRDSLGARQFERAEHERMVRVVLGPDEDRFEEEAIEKFFGSSFAVSGASDRRGIRLEGPALAHRGSADVAPEGAPLGAVQVPRDGQPIVLGPDRPVTGGYPRLGTVIGADFAMVAQALPGESLRFRAVDVATALHARRRAGLPAGTREAAELG